MHSFLRSLPLLLLLALPLSASAASLKSPWDSPIALTDAAYTCGPNIHLSTDINFSSKTPVAPADYDRSYPAVLALSTKVVKAADKFRATGSRAAAQCVVDQLFAAANSYALTGKMVNADAWQQQERAINAFAIAMLKIRGSGLPTTKQNNLINSWLNVLVENSRDHYNAVAKSQVKCDYTEFSGLSSDPELYYPGISGREGGIGSDPAPPDMICKRTGNDLRGHNGLYLAMDATVVGILNNDRKLYDWGIQQYQIAVRHIKANGTLPFDTKDKWSAKFNLESAAALVQIAEFALANGDNLYDYHNGDIHRLVKTAVAGLTNPAIYQEITHAEQVSQQPPARWEIAWAQPYNQRYPNPLITALLQKLGTGDPMWGGKL